MIKKCRGIVRQLFITTASLVIIISLHAQKVKSPPVSEDSTAPPKTAGSFSLGLRTIISSFTDGDPRAYGYGAGGHARLQVIEQVNTEWFGDVITNNIRNQAHRTDFHIGWSVMYYFIPTKGFQRKFTPYVLAGHCFDETVVKLNGEGAPSASRFSSAVQAGMGCHYNITPKFDISLAVQYMLHLGKEIDAEEQANGTMAIVTHKNAGWEGHLLISVSANYKVARLWKGKRKKYNKLRKLQE